MKQKLTAALLDVSLRDSRFCAELLRMLTKGGEAPSGPPQYIGRPPEEPLRSGVRVQTQGKTADISIVENAVPKEDLEDMVWQSHRMCWRFSSVWKELSGWMRRLSRYNTLADRAFS